MIGSAGSGLDLGEQVNKLDVGGEDQGLRWNRVEVELGME